MTTLNNTAIGDGYDFTVNKNESAIREFFSYDAAISFIERENKAFAVAPDSFRDAAGNSFDIIY